MNGADVEPLKQRIMALFALWQPRLGLSHWDIIYTWKREKKASDEGTIMTVITSWEYQKADVWLYLPTCAEQEEADQLEDAVVHELCHILVAMMSVGERAEDTPLDVLKDKLEELTVTHLARVLQTAYSVTLF